MKNTFKIALILAALALPCAAFAAFAETAPAAFPGEIIFSLFAIVGLQLITLTDRSRHTAPKPAAAPTAPQSRRCYGLDRRECPAL